MASKDTRTIEELEFELFLPEERIQQRVGELAREIAEDVKDLEKVTFVCILKGSMMFTADLIRALDKPCYVEFVRCKSYRGLTSSRTPQINYSSCGDLSGHHVIILEDILETGHTLELIQDYLRQKRPADMRIATLLRKPESLEKEIFVDYVGFDIGKEFVVGYGLDYEGVGRNWPSIYQLPVELEDVPES